MSWDETRRRWQAIREITSVIERDATGELPWDETYAEIFGDRDSLVRALEYRWTLMVQAQLDPELPDAVLAETFRKLTVRNAGLLRVLDRCANGEPYAAATKRMEGIAVVHA
ncbi:hypothetical protein [Solicola gregarius]|uniref:Uncharacterized protein n=1 Tax=Solicola gregarius TaxID=2908642 RepID=A0AA46YNC6_9ACTN|nr:hypothetical protein [Solicola gregarius]UYM07454.1 hypothetical protein L0C25_10405 [Solicola gregarius]